MCLSRFASFPDSRKPLKVAFTSDWHKNPGDNFNDMEVPECDVWIDVGDAFNILPIGIDEWLTRKGHYTVDSYDNATLPAKKRYFLPGNHGGRLSWCKRLLAPYDIEVVRSLDIGGVHFEHGDKYCEWRILGLFADDLTEWATTNKLSRRLWYAFCQRQGWLPGNLEGKPKYNKTIGAYWGIACNVAHTKGYKKLVIGHSHSPETQRTAFCEVVDCGKRQVLTMEV